MRKAFVPILALLLASSLFAAETEQAPVMSHGKNFAVFSSDTAVASWAAREAEQQREGILSDFHWTQQWDKPVVLHVERGPAWGKENTLVFADEEDARRKLRDAALNRILRRPPFWLQCGMNRYVSGRDDFFQAPMRRLRSSSAWLDLHTVLECKGAITPPQWQDIFEREAASLVMFLKKRHPLLLADAARGEVNAPAILALEKDWLRWIDATTVMSPKTGGKELIEAMRPRSAGNNR